MSLKRRHMLRRVAKGFMALALLTMPGPRIAAQTIRKPETPYEVRAVFLYKFAQFTEWPKEAFADENAPFVFGILGKDPFGKDIDIIKGATLKGRKLEVKYFSEVKEVKNCHILFISDSEEKWLPEILKALENTSILTVGEMDRFVERNGVLNFLPGREKRPYEINQAAAEKARLRIHSSLLAGKNR